MVAHFCDKFEPVRVTIKQIRRSDNLSWMKKAQNYTREGRYLRLLYFLELKTATVKAQ